METACLRIKFTPLLQSIYKENSKQYLEIVPEVSCIQNLDKIQWRKEENAIEYTIPMTYKIILRKNEISKDKNENHENLDKTYYSCVDLLLPSSELNIEEPLGSGDVNRFVSDTFLLSKVTANVGRCNILLKEKDQEMKVNNPVKSPTVQVQTETNSIFDEVVHDDLIKNRKTREAAVTQTLTKVVQSEYLTQVSHTDIFDSIKRSIHEITNQSLTAGTPKMGADVITLDSVTRNTNNNKNEPKSKLSLSPICSVSTRDNRLDPSPPNNCTANTIVFRVYEPSSYFTNEINDDTVKFKEEADDVLYDARQRFQEQYDYVSDFRINPAVRVANFIQIMESEIMPLKLMLGDIINKCSSFGFIWKKPQSSVIYKNLPHSNNSSKQSSRCCKTKKQTKSNRVVYTIIFEE